MNSNPQPSSVKTTEGRPTPGPWKTFGRTIYAGETPVVLAIAEFDAEVSPVYGNDARHPLKNDDEASANAELIVTAVNSHAAMLAACKDIAECAENPSQVNGDILTRIASVARSAIALAQEGK